MTYTTFLGWSRKTILDAIPASMRPIASKSTLICTTRGLEVASMLLEVASMLLETSWIDLAEVSSEADLTGKDFSVGVGGVESPSLFSLGGVSGRDSPSPWKLII